MKEIKRREWGGMVVRVIRIGKSLVPVTLIVLRLDCRCHIISQFNQGLYDCVIATDAEILGPQVKGKRRGRGSKGDK